jgi:hypothetical protein
MRTLLIQIDGNDIMNIVYPVLAAAMLMPVGAAAAQQNDLREFHVGMPVSSLPQSGYGEFACIADPAKKLSGWGDYKACPVGADRTYALSFRYADGGEGDSKTEVAGQPVNLALLISDNAQVTGLRIETDPHTRLYLHKKAYLFALQVRARFGEDGWTCRKAEPTATEQPIGGVFVKEHCEKETATRHFVLDRALYRDPAKELSDFTDATQFAILIKN